MFSFNNPKEDTGYLAVLKPQESSTGNSFNATTGRISQGVTFNFVLENEKILRMRWYWMGRFFSYKGNSYTNTPRWKQGDSTINIYERKLPEVPWAKGNIVWHEGMYEILTWDPPPEQWEDIEGFIYGSQMSDLFLKDHSDFSVETEWGRRWGRWEKTHWEISAIILVRHERNLGQGSGIRAALSEGF